MKFKVGDKIKVKDNSKYHKGEYAGLKGTVIKIAGIKYPYYCILKTKEHQGEIAFHANELELDNQ